MKKPICVFLCLLFLLAPVLSGCKKETDIAAIPVPEIPPDYVFLGSDMVYYKDGIGNFVYIPIISSFSLMDQDITVMLDEYTMPEGSVQQPQFDEPRAVPMPFYVYQSYRGKDWAAYAKLQLAYKRQEGVFLQQDDNGKDMEAYEVSANMLMEAQDEFLEDYTLLQEAGKLPMLYYGILRLNLPEGERMDVQNITLRIGDTAKTFPVGKIQQSGNDKSWDSEPEIFQVVGNGGWRVVRPNAEGTFPEVSGEDNFGFESSADTTITGIGLDDGRSLTDIQVVILSVWDKNNKEVVADFIWDGTSPIALKKGQRFYLNFTFHDPRLCSLWGYTEYDPEIRYLDSKGQERTTEAWLPMYIMTAGADPFEIYLTHELGIDMMAYYRDLLDPLEEYGGVTIIHDK